MRFARFRKGNLSDGLLCSFSENNTGHFTSQDNFTNIKMRTIPLALLCLSFGFKTQVVIGCCIALKDKQKVLRRTTEVLLL